MIAGARGGVVREAVLAPTHREILWPSAHCEVFFSPEKCFLLAIEFWYWENTAFFFCVVLPISVIPATVERNKRRRGKIGTHRARRTSSTRPRVAPYTAPQQVPNWGVRNTPLSPPTTRLGSTRGKLIFARMTCSCRATLSIKIITVYPSSTISEELFCRMFLFQYEVKCCLGSFMLKPWLCEKSLCRKINSHWPQKKIIQLVW